MVDHHLQSFSAMLTKPPLSILVLSSSTPTRRSFVKPPNLKRLTSRVVLLTQRRQLHQVFAEIEKAKKRYGKLNTIVMNAVLEACVHCGDIDSALKVFEEMSEPQSCGVDGVTYGTLIKGLGAARRIDEAFQILESLEVLGHPKLSAPIIFGLLNALVKTGDLRRANGVLARYGFLIREGGNPSPLIYNLLMKGHINTGCPEDALTVHEEMLRLGLTPDKLTYNTLIFACVKAEKLDVAMRFFDEMKEKAEKTGDDNFYPDVATYTTLLKGFGNIKDIYSVKKIILKMKLQQNLSIDRTAYTATVDALINCGSIRGALCVFGEIIKRVGVNPDLGPKPHLYLSLMRVFTNQGDYIMVNNLLKRMWLDSTGTIHPTVQEEADHLLMESALNGGQVDLAVQHLSDIIAKWKGISWTSRGGTVAVRIAALLGYTKPMFSPSLLPEVSLEEPIENIMMPLKEAQPLLGTVRLRKVVMRLFRDKVVPVIDEWGSCVGLLHREDCNQLDAPIMTMMRSPPPCVTTTTTVGHVINMILEKKLRMVVVVKYSSGSKAVGVFTGKQLLKLLVTPVEDIVGQDPTTFRRRQCVDFLKREFV